MAESALERLDRILYILPRAMRQGGVTIEELARVLSCDPARILGDLTEITARAFYHPPGVADQLQIMIENGRVEIWSVGDFKRPAKLTPSEGLALGLGLRMLACEAEGPRRSQILALARKLEDEVVISIGEAGAPTEVRAPHLLLRGWVCEEPQVEYGDDSPRVRERPAVPPSIGRPSERAASFHALAPRARDPVSVDVGEDGFRSEFADAARDRLLCQVTYLKPGDAEPSLRTIAPYQLVYASGAWYVLAHDADRGEVRAFRMDRMMKVDVTDEPFDAPSDFDASDWLTAAGSVYRSPDHEVIATVHYSARIARWIEERFDCEPVADGGVLVRHGVADPNWIVRHVLKYGADARLIEPAALRARVAKSALRQTA
ncbi:MAG: helix-turn-helix transcriptional regulator [Longimicrobiales bacterium]